MINILHGTLLSSHWPSAQKLKLLVERSGGLLICAATIEVFRGRQWVFCGSPWLSKRQNSAVLGKASVITKTITTRTETGIEPASGQALETNIIITAPGFKLKIAGGARIFVDNFPVTIRVNTM